MAIAFPVDALALISVANPPAAPDAETVPVATKLPALTATPTASIPVGLIVTPEPTLAQNAVTIPPTASIPEGLIVTAEPTLAQYAVTIPAAN